MTLVEYSSSSDESTSSIVNTEIGASRSNKRKREKTEIDLPPLPQTFHSLYSTSTRTHPSDDPALHGGRTRQVPHVEGNWPSHVYLEWYPTRPQLEALQGVFDAANVECQGQVHSLLRSELGAQLPLHISLSVPLVLRSEQRNDFEENVGAKIRESGIGPVHVRVRKLRWERNFDGTRWFLVLGLSKPENDELNRLLDCCNECASEFGLPVLYGKAAGLQRMNARDQSKKGKSAVQDRTEAFHISVAWQLAEPPPAQKTAFENLDVTELCKDNLRFEVVKLKMGNIVKDIPLTNATMKS